jgi:hypothetical protein
MSVLTKADLDDLRNRVEAIESKEEQGYEAAPYLCKISGVTPRQLLISIIAPDNALELDEDAQRDIGVVMWCVDQLRGNGDHNRPEDE